MTDFFMTFGVNYAHGTNYVRIVAPNRQVARRAAIEHFGNKWSMLYDKPVDKQFFPDGELFAFQVDDDLNIKRLRNDDLAEAGL